MLKFVVRFLVSQLNPADLIELGKLLTSAGFAARDRQTAITNALAAVRGGVNALTN